MSYAIYNRNTNKVLTFVSKPKGKLPDGFEFVEDKLLPMNYGLEIVKQPTVMDILKQHSLLFLEACNSSGIFNSENVYLVYPDGEIKQVTIKDIEKLNIIPILEQTSIQ